MSKPVISTVAFMDDGSVVITYMDPSSDVRNRGLLVASHQLHIARGGGRDYQVEVEVLEEAALALLVDALEDFAETEAQVGVVQAQQTRAHELDERDSDDSDENER